MTCNDSMTIVCFRKTNNRFIIQIKHIELSYLENHAGMNKKSKLTQMVRVESEVLHSRLNNVTGVKDKIMLIHSVKLHMFL